MAEILRNNGPSEYSSVENNPAVRGSPPGTEPTAARGNSADDRAAVRGSPRGAEPTSVQHTSAAVPAAGGAGQGDMTSSRETTLQEDASRNLGVTRRRRAAVYRTWLSQEPARAAKRCCRMGYIPRR